MMAENGKMMLGMMMMKNGWILGMVGPHTGLVYMRRNHLLRLAKERRGPQTLTRVSQAVAPWARDSSVDTLALCVLLR